MQVWQKRTFRRGGPAGALAYHVRFVGGPCDGLTVDADSAGFEAEEILSMPARPILRRARRGCYELMGHCRAAYRMTHQRRAKAGRSPAVDVRYDFSGFEFLRDCTVTHPPGADRGLALATRWRRTLAGLISKLGDLLARRKPAVFTRAFARAQE